MHGSGFCASRGIFALVLHCLALGLSSCAFKGPLRQRIAIVAEPSVSGRESGVREGRWRAGDGKEMPFRYVPANDSTLPSNTARKKEESAEISSRRALRRGEKKTGAVLICVHGLGAVGADFDELARNLAAKGHPVYSMDLRGHGLDPDVNRRGDIVSEKFWRYDLRAFHRLVQARHPGVPVVWLGESLGSLIVMTTAADSGMLTWEKPAGIILTAPAAGLRAPPPDWVLGGLRGAAALLPGLRVSLEGLSGQQFQMTSGTTHLEQSATRAEYLTQFTLRMIRVIDGMMLRMPHAMESWTRPLLVLYSPNDPLSSAAQVEGLFARSASRRKSAHRFDKSYHLMFHDVEREQATKLTADFLDSLSLKKGARKSQEREN